MTRSKTVLSLLTTLILLAVLPISSAQSQDTGVLERLSALNRINPLQNKKYDSSDKVLRRNMQDRKNKIIGEIKDITVSNNGGVETITTDFNRLHLSNDVALNFRELRIRTLGNSYALNMDADEVEDIYPQLLANINTASGDGASALSINRIVGSELLAEDGRRIGHIRQALFGANGARVDALFVELAHGKNRGKTAAIPFRGASFDEKNGRLRATISNDLTEALFKVAE